uniref:Putative secreted protein n=1 Tax=Anopheles darlingi TaxID=43151 RepID=A0A2M4DA62_ANODA
MCFASPCSLLSRLALILSNVLRVFIFPLNWEHFSLKNVCYAHVLRTVGIFVTHTVHDCHRLLTVWCSHIRFEGPMLGFWLLVTY